MTKLSQFVDMGSDTATCEYLSKSMGDDTLQKSGVDMDIIKAKREGLVPKMVEVHGPHGTYQAVRMVRPGEKPKAGKSSKGNALSSIMKDKPTCKLGQGLKDGIMPASNKPIVEEMGENASFYNGDDFQDKDFEAAFKEIDSNMELSRTMDDGDGGDVSVGYYKGRKVATMSHHGGHAIIIGEKHSSKDVSGLMKKEPDVDFEDMFYTDDSPEEKNLSDNLTKELGSNPKVYTSEGDEKEFEAAFREVSSNLKGKKTVGEDGDGNEWTVGTYKGKKFAVASTHGGDVLMVGSGSGKGGNALSTLSKQEATCEMSDLEIDDYPVISKFGSDSKMYSSEDAEDSEAFEKLYNDISSNMKDKVEAEQDGDGNDWTVGTYNGKKVAISDGTGGQAIIVGGKKKSLEDTVNEVWEKHKSKLAGVMKENNLSESHMKETLLGAAKDEMSASGEQPSSKTIKDFMLDKDAQW